MNRSLISFERISNPNQRQHEINRVQDLHKKRLELIANRKPNSRSSTLDNAKPLSSNMKHVRQRLKHRQLQENREEEIHRENQVLLGKMAHIMISPSPMFNDDGETALHSRKLSQAIHRAAVNGRKTEKLRIFEENKALVERLSQCNSSFSKEGWAAKREEEKVLLDRLRKHKYKHPSGSIAKSAHDGLVELNEDIKRRSQTMLLGTDSDKPIKYSATYSSSTRKSKGQKSAHQFGSTPREDDCSDQSVPKSNDEKAVTVRATETVRTSSNKTCSAPKKKLPSVRRDGGNRSREQRKVSAANEVSEDPSNTDEHQSSSSQPKLKERLSTDINLDNPMSAQFREETIYLCRQSMQIVITTLPDERGTVQSAWGVVTVHEDDNGSSFSITVHAKSKESQNIRCRGAISLMEASTLTGIHLKADQEDDSTQVEKVALALLPFVRLQAFGCDSKSNGRYRLIVDQTTPDLMTSLPPEELDGLPSEISGEEGEKSEGLERKVPIVMEDTSACVGQQIPLVTMTINTSTTSSGEVLVSCVPHERTVNIGESKISLDSEYTLTASPPTLVAFDEEAAKKFTREIMNNLTISVGEGDTNIKLIESGRVREPIR